MLRCTLCFLTMAEVLSQKLKLQGSVSPVVSLCVGVGDCGSVGNKGRGWEKEKGTEKELKGLCIMQCFRAKACCCFSKAAALLLETGDTHRPQSPTVRLLAGVQEHQCWFEWQYIASCWAAHLSTTSEPKQWRYALSSPEMFLISFDFSQTGLERWSSRPPASCRHHCTSPSSYCCVTEVEDLFSNGTKRQ